MNLVKKPNNKPVIVTKVTWPTPKYILYPLCQSIYSTGSLCLLGLHSKSKLYRHGNFSLCDTWIARDGFKYDNWLP